MSGGGSTPAPAPSTTTQIQDIPTWEQGYVTSLLGQAQSVAAQPYQQFPGQQVAGFTPDQTQAFSNVENAGAAYNPLQASAANSATGAGATANSIYGAGAPLLAAGASAATPGGINAYMSPYLSSAVQGDINAANENWNQNIMPGVNNEFVNAGQSMSGRNAQVLGQAANQEQTNLEGQVANLENTGYGQASANAQNEAGNLLSAGNSLGNLASTQAGAQNASAATQGNLASQTAATNLTQDQALQAVGQQQQAQNQTNLNTAQTNWQNQVNYPAQQTEYLNQIIRGLPASSATTSASQTTPLGVYAPSPLSGVGGSGVAGLAALAGGTNNTPATPSPVLKKGGLIKKYAAGGLISDSEDGNTTNPLDLSELNNFDPDPATHISEQASPLESLFMGHLSDDDAMSDMPASDAAPLATAPPSVRPTASAVPPDYSAADKGDAPNPVNAANTSIPSGDSGGRFKPMSDSQMQQYQLLALARGMLSPTKTGSPWESLGNSVGEASDVMMQQQKWNAEMQQRQNDMDYRNKMLGIKQQGVNQTGTYQQGRLDNAKDANDIKANAQNTTLSKEAIEAGADSIHSGVPMSAITGMGQAPDRRAILERYSEKYPGENLSTGKVEMAGNMAGARTIGSSGGRIELAGQSLESMIPLAKDALSKIDLTQYPSLNALENAVRKGTGDPNIIAANTYLQAVAADHAALMVRGGQGNVAAQEKARDMINANMAKGQTDAYFDAVQHEKVAQDNAIKNAKSVVYGNGSVSGTQPSGSTQPAGTKTATQADIAQTAKSSGKTIEQVTKAMKDRGYTIQ